MMDANNSERPGEKRTPHDLALDQLAHQILDDGSSVQPLEQCSAEARQRVVDLQWLDAMLEQSQKSTDSTKAAINSVLTRLRAEVTDPLGAKGSEAGTAGKTIQLVEASAVQSRDLTQPQERRFVPRRARRWRSSLAIVGTLAVVLILCWPWQRQSADAMFERAMAAAAVENDDRVYQVTITRRDDSMSPRKAQLTVRGGKKFVFEQTGPLGGRLVIGGNGREFWLVPRLGPVMVGDSDDLLPDWTQKSGADMPFLQITTALKRMQAHYVMTHLPAEEVAGHVGMLNHLVARRRFRNGGRFGFAPSQIDLWADPESGIVNRLVIQWPNEAKGHVPEKVELDLTNQVPSGDEVYDYVHYAGDRQIEHLQSSK